MNLCVTVEGSPRVNVLPSSSSSTWPEMSNKSNPVSLLPHLVQVIIHKVGRDSSVGIATNYGLDGPESNTGGDEISRPSRLALGTTQPPVK